MNFKKALFITLLLGSFALPVAAQMNKTPLYLLNYDYNRRWRFGFSVGANVFDYTLINSMNEISAFGERTTLWGEVVELTPGFNINGIVNYRLTENLDLRTLPGICFGTRKIDFYLPDGSLYQSMALESNYAEVPILVKYSAKRTSNYRPYLVGGFNSRINMNWKTNEEKGVFIATNIYEPFYELGFGLDIYFYYFKLSFEFKYSGGFTNALSSRTVIGYEFYQDVISRLNSQIFMFSIHIE